MLFRAATKDILREHCIIVPSVRVLTGRLEKLHPRSHVRHLALASKGKVDIAVGHCRPNVILFPAYCFGLAVVKNIVHQHYNMPKRKRKNSNHPQKIPKFAHERQFEDVEYYFENGLRKIKPYVYKFECYAKGRWFGSKLLDVFKKEFRLESAEYYETAIREGLIRVNKAKASPDRILKNNDFMQSKVHRHEPPVSGEPIQVIAETQDYLVINKPSSIPVHPCGKYRHNTIVFILGKEYGFKGLHTIHRLDRLTSGILLFARTLEVSHRLDAYVRDRELEKTYVCKTQGEFPSTPVVCEEPIFIVSHKIGVCRVKEDGKPCKTTFERLSYDGETSIVKCYPHTGRMHQIRVHLQYLGFPIVNDPLYNNTVWGQCKGKGGNKKLTDEQLLKDLIEQHDIEIDSALEKARLQTLINKPRSPNHTISEGLQESSKDTVRDAIKDSVDDQTSNIPSLKGLEKPCQPEEQLKNSTTDEQENAMRNQNNSHRECSQLDASPASISANNELTCLNDGVDTGKDGNDLQPHIGSDAGKGNVKSNEEMWEPSDKVRTSNDEERKNRSSDAVLDIDDDTGMEAKDVDTKDKRTSDWKVKDDCEEERLLDEKTDKLAVSLCRECRNPMPDPEPNEMCIYLHALTYKGPEFEFSAPMPAWAQEHFERTGTKYS
ncbi:RNA pseudouridylate synthase domain-containing protein 2-like [Lytechinus variegatus]|uniref:RNA pseudouridylate synthase domain-containing protein 2-like n=1 Tax=Lytechinus variegatus TaxID=7654 RepID=UPI001BB1C928|nr:RNA pseudouridylate synthase domain-containing protein 2-like [Lytechinus variegatus]